jgi:hypothetical protein
MTINKRFPQFANGPASEELPLQAAWAVCAGEN